MTSYFSAIARIISRNRTLHVGTNYHDRVSGNISRSSRQLSHAVKEQLNSWEIQHVKGSHAHTKWGS